MDTGTLGQGPIFGDDPIEDQELDLFSRGDYANRAVEVLHNLSNHQHSTVGSITRRLARRLVQDAQVMSIQAVSRRHRVSWHLIMGLVCDWSGLIGTRRRRQKCRVLLIDETSIRKRHRYVTVVVNGDSGEVLAMFQGRSKTSLSRFFVEQGPRWCHNVQTVVTDGSRSYRAAIGRCLPGAPHVFDRFHAVRRYHPRTDPGTPGAATPPAARCETSV